MKSKVGVVLLWTRVQRLGLRNPDPPKGHRHISEAHKLEKLKDEAQHPKKLTAKQRKL